MTWGDAPVVASKVWGRVFMQFAWVVLAFIGAGVQFTQLFLPAFAAIHCGPFGEFEGANNNQELFISE